jgi:DNA-binding transcriptional LysR family regulator
MALSGAGIAILPRFLAEPELMRLLPETIDIDRIFWLSVHREIADNASTKALTDFLPKHIKKLQEIL